MQSGLLRVGVGLCARACVREGRRPAEGRQEFSRSSWAGGGGSRCRKRAQAPGLGPPAAPMGRRESRLPPGGATQGGGDVIYYFTILSLSSSTRCVRPPHQPRTSPSHLACTPGVHGHPARTHDAAPPTQRTRATCLTTPEHARHTHPRQVSRSRPGRATATSCDRAGARAVYMWPGCPPLECHRAPHPLPGGSARHTRGP